MKRRRADVGRHVRTLLDGALVHTFARRVDAAREVDHVADLDPRQILARRRQIELDGFQLGHPRRSSGTGDTARTLPQHTAV